MQRKLFLLRSYEELQRVWMNSIALHRRSRIRASEGRDERFQARYVLDQHADPVPTRGIDERLHGHSVGGEELGSCTAITVVIPGTLLGAGTWTGSGLRKPKPPGLFCADRVAARAGP